MKSNLSSKDLYDAFKYFDEDDTGKINLEQIKHGLMTLGEPLSEEEIKTLEDELDFDEEGNFDYGDLAKKIYGNKINFVKSGFNLLKKEPDIKESDKKEEKVDSIGVKNNTVLISDSKENKNYLNQELSKCINEEGKADFNVYFF